MEASVYIYIYIYIWSNYSDLTRPHPKWWFSKGNPLNSGKSRLVKYYNLARYIYIYISIYLDPPFGCQISAPKRSVFGGFFGGSNFRPDWRIQVYNVCIYIYIYYTNKWLESVSIDHPGIDVQKHLTKSGTGIYPMTITLQFVLRPQSPKDGSNKWWPRPAATTHLVLQGLLGPGADRFSDGMTWGPARPYKWPKISG